MNDISSFPRKPLASEKRQKIRDALNSGKIMVTPGCYDGFSARMIEKKGFKFGTISGAGVSNSRFSQPDIGILSLLENADACKHIARSVSIPLIADADTGYGNAVTVYHAVEYFEEAGVAGINIEDQVTPKRCGHMRGKAVIDSSEGAAKIEAAVRARRDPNFIINARTDAIAVEGLDGAIKRARLYLAAGADIVYPDAIGSEEDIKRFLEGIGGRPMNVNMGFGIRNRPTTPLITPVQLQAMGVARVSYARMLPAAAVSAMDKALELLMDSATTGTVHDRPDLIAGIDEVTDLMGYPFISALEARVLSEEELQERYRDAERSFVLHGH